MSGIKSKRREGRRLPAGFLALMCLLAGSLLLMGNNARETAPAAESEAAILLEIEGPIGPATEDYIRRALAQAAEQSAPVAIVEMDTPGGLDSSMRGIVRGILESAVPVAVYIAPEGARGASAGTYILYAAHVAAMAPATSVGAATPVQIGGGGGILPQEDEEAEEGGANEPLDAMERKVINDAVSYIRGLAELRGRNGDWAEEAVRQGVTLTASEALEKGVIEIVAPDLATLLEEMDGLTVQVQRQERELATRGLEIERMEPDWRTRLLSILTNPNVAFILMLLGIYGLILEFANPGALVPGITGAICLLLALFAFQMLPINYAGLALILLGIALMIAEAFAPSFGALGIGGLIAFVLGSIILIDTDLPGFQLYLSVILGFAAVSLLVLILFMTMALKAWRLPVVSGKEGLIGTEGAAMEAFESVGHVRVAGEIWKARSPRPVEKGQRVKVIRVEGLVLAIEPIAKPEPEDKKP